MPGAPGQPGTSGMVPPRSSSTQREDVPTFDDSTPSIATTPTGTPGKATPNTTPNAASKAASSDDDTGFMWFVGSLAGLMVCGIFAASVILYRRWKRDAEAEALVGGPANDEPPTLP